MDPTTQKPAMPFGAPDLATPLYQTTCYMKTKGIGINVGKLLVSVYPGRLIVTNPKTNETVFDYQLTPDVKVRSFGSIVGIAYLNGRKIGRFEKGYQFQLLSPMWILLSYWYMLFGAKRGKALKQAIEQAGTTGTAVYGQPAVS